MKRSAWYLAWVIAGLVFGVGFLGGFSVGLYVLPVGIALLLVVAFKGPGWPEAIGFSLGPGIFCLAVARGQFAITPCPGRHPAGVVCGESHPWGWLIAGLLLAGVGLFGYLLMRASEGRVR